MLKVLFTGPESTGKSYLAQRLAKHFNTQWVPEYAREYLDRLSRAYQQEDLIDIAKGQFAWEEKWAAQAKNLLFCDTGPIVLKVWSLMKYGNCHPWIDQQVSQRHYDLYCLCSIDLPWSYDPLREHQNVEDRKTLYQMYKKELQNLGRPWIEVRGNTEERIHICVKATGKLLQSYRK